MTSRHLGETNWELEILARQKTQATNEQMPADETVKTLKTLTHYPAHQSHLCAIYNLQGVIKKLA